MPLYITEYAGVSSGAGSSYPRGLIASQSLTIGGTTDESDPLAAGTTLLRLIADADCNVAIGPAADANTDAVIALVVDVETFVHVSPGDIVSVIQRV